MTKISSAHFQASMRRMQTFREQEIQKACVRWFNLQYPTYKRLLHANYNNAKDKVTGGINQGMGVLAGAADLEFLFAGELHFIEVKTPDGTQSDAQKVFEQDVTSQGATYTIVRSVEEFIKLIRSIIPDSF